MTPERPPDEPSESDFEEFVTAALKVDPKGLSGKHRHEDPSHVERERDD